MKFGRMLVLSLAALLVAVPAVHAQDEDLGELTTKKPAKRTVEEESNDPARPGPMLGLGVIYAHENFEGPSARNNAGAKVSVDPSDTAGYNAHVGYRFNRWVAADLHVERYHKFDANDSVTDADVGRINGWALGINGKVYALPGRIQPYGLMGLNYLKMETTVSTFANRNKTDDGAALRFGAGVDLYATSNFVLTTDISYMLGLSQVDGYDILTVGLGFLYRP